MALDKELIVIPFTGGLDEGADPHVITQPLLKKAENLQTHKDGSLELRDGTNAVASGPSGNPRMYRYKDGAFIVSETDYATFDTSRDVVSGGGAISKGYGSKLEGANDALVGGYNTRTTRIQLDGRNCTVVAHNRLDQLGRTQINIRVYDGDANVSIFEYNDDDAYLLSCDYVESSNAAVFMTRWESSTPVTSFGAEALGFFVLRHDGTGFTVDTVFVDEPTITAQTSSGVPKAIRQGHCSNTSPDRLNYIINLLPTNSRPQIPGLAPTGDAAWGETLVGRLVVPSVPSIPIFDYITEVSDGATAAYDGSAMVTIGGNDLNGIVAATCSMIDGGVRAWSWNNGTQTAGPALLFYDGIKGYGPLWIAPSPGAKGADRKAWFPGLDVSVDYLESVFLVDQQYPLPNLESNYGALYSYCPNSTLSYGHNFMYGYVQLDAFNRPLISFHGMLYVGSKRTAAWRSSSGVGDTYVGMQVKESIRTLGTVFAVLQSDLSSAVDTVEAHNCHLLSYGVQDANTDNDWDFNLAISSKWFMNIQPVDPGNGAADRMVTDNLAGFMTLREQLPETNYRDLDWIGVPGPSDYPKPFDNIGVIQTAPPYQQYHSGISVKLRIPNSNVLDVETTSLYSQDEIVPHTSPVYRWNMSSSHLLLDLMGGQDPGYPDFNPDPVYWSSVVVLPENEDWRLFDIHTSGGYWDADRNQFVVGGTRWRQVDIDNLWDGPRGLKKYNSLTGDGLPYFDWEDSARRFGPVREFTPCYVRLFDPATIGINTPQNVIVTAGNAMVFDGTNLFPLQWYIPPQPLLLNYRQFLGGRTQNNGGDPARMSVQACWFYKDDVGTTWRSATSFKYDMGVAMFRRGASDPDSQYVADKVLTGFDRSIPIPVPMRGKLGIEYYMTQPTDSTVEVGNLTGDGQMALWAWSDAERSTSGPIYPPEIGDVSPEIDAAYPFTGLSIGWGIRYRKTNTILLYTTGGVLDDEPPIAPSYLAFTNNRVWYTRDGRLYFSKTVSKDKPIGFNGALYVDAPTGEDLVACAAMDENVVAFGRNTIFLVTGVGPNDLGFTGKSNFTVNTLATAVGCYNPNSVVSTDVGIFYAGYDTLYLIRRDANVVRIGKVEDSFSVQNCRYAFYDRDGQRILWYIRKGKDADYFVVYEIERNMWFTWGGGDYEDDLTGSIWTPNGIHHIANDGTILRQDATYNRPAARIKTGWVNLANAMHYKRFRDGYLVTRQNTPSQIDVNYSYDYEEASTETRSYTTVTGDADLGRFKPARQKCAALALDFVVDNPQGAVLSHMAFEVGKKMLGDKTPRK